MADKATRNVTAGRDGNSTATGSAWLGSSDDAEMLIISLQLMSSAIGIIYLGAHASLRRPPSAAPAKRWKVGSDGRRIADKKPPKDDGFAEGLVASDAIMFPVMAGVMLVGLYYLIQWLQDAELVNKLLRIYMSVFSLVSLAALCSDALEVITNCVFPNKWAGLDGRLYNVEFHDRTAHEIDLTTGARAPVGEIKTPLPTSLGNMLPNKVNDLLWDLRHFCTQEFTVKLSAMGLGNLQAGIKLSMMIGGVLAAVCIATYHFTGWTLLSNLQGAAFSYAAFAITSPTSFGIGNMVLAGLFVYDVVMVFYTPYMITVATALDVPIKLVYHGSSRSSMLGLGDIVIPGIFIGLALRFDLYQYYRRQMQHVATDLVSEKTSNDTAETVKTTDTRYRQVKKTFEDPRGQWGDRIWTMFVRHDSPALASALPPPGFPKVYFFAAMAGYAVGMAITLTMLLVFKRGQPALLYLVPCVTGAVSLTGAVRGELRELYSYTEDGSLDTEDVVVELDADGNVVKQIEDKKSTEESKVQGKHESKHGGKLERKDHQDNGNASADAPPNVVFSLSVTWPPFPPVKED